MTVDGVLTYPVNGIYTISNIQSNKHVIISIEKIPNFDVDYELIGITRPELNLGKGDKTNDWTLNEVVVVDRDKSFKFNLSDIDGNVYDKSTLKVTVNGEEVMSSEGSYTIPSIIENKHVVISIGKWPKYKVDYQLSGITSSEINVDKNNNGSSWALTEVISKDRNSDFTFKVSGIDYSIYDSSTLKVTVNGKEVKLNSDGIYTVRGITEDKHIVIYIAEKDKYNVTYALGGELVASEVSVHKNGSSIIWNSTENIVKREGDSFTFNYSSINWSKYNINTLQVTINGTPVSLVPNGTYTISNINENKHIIISANELSRYKVYYTLEGFDNSTDIKVWKYSTNQSWSQADQEQVYKGGSFQFKLSDIDTDKYTLLKVTVNGNDFTLSSFLAGEISNISEDKHVVISVKRTYKVEYQLHGINPSELLFSYRNNGGSNVNWGYQSNLSQVIKVISNNSFYYQYRSSLAQNRIMITLDGRMINLSGNSWIDNNVIRDYHFDFYKLYKVTFVYNDVEISGYGINKAENWMKESDDYTFVLDNIDGTLYDVNSLKITINSDPTNKAHIDNNSYTLTNINCDIVVTITINGLKPNINPDATIKADVHKWEDYRTIDGGSLLPL